MSEKTYARVSGAWKELNPIYGRVGGAWKEFTEGYVKVGGAWKLVYQPIGVPSAPLSLTASSVTSSGCTLTWEAPSSDGGSSITNYEIWYSTSPSGEYVFLQDAGAALTDDVSGLTADMDYYFKVLATNENGDGPFSEVESIHSTAIAIPFTPTVSATSSTSSSVTLSVTENAAGGTPEYYDVYYARAGSSSFSSYVVSYTGSPQSIAVPLSSNRHYEFRVKARNADGESAYSNSVWRSTSRSGTGTLTTLVAANNPCPIPYPTVGFGRNTSSIGGCGTSYGSFGASSLNGYAVEAIAIQASNACFLRFLGNAPSNVFRSIRIYPDGNEHSPLARSISAGEMNYVNHPGQYSDFVMVGNPVALLMSAGQSYRASIEL